jgi:hypothetical protein
MRVREARELGEWVTALVQAGQMTRAYALLAPVLAARTPFPILGRIGAVIGVGPLEPMNRFLEHVAAARTEGGWVVIGSALGQQLARDPEGAFARCREFIVAADVWYGADILGERVPGPALVANFEPALDLLAPWREDSSRWVRRAVGVSVHFWAKRSRGDAEHAPHAAALLAFLEPMFGEWDMNANWLAQQVVPGQRRHRTLMLRKALTYLSDEQRARATEGSR